MQYVGQTCRALQKRFGEHSPNDVLVQPVEKLTYDKNSTSRFKIIKRFETELKWIKLLQTPFPSRIDFKKYREEIAFALTL